MKITGQKSVVLEAECRSISDFKEKHPDFSIEAVDDHLVLATCVGCGGVILCKEFATCKRDFNGDYWHENCEQSYYGEITSNSK